MLAMTTLGQVAVGIGASAVVLIGMILLDTFLRWIDA